MISSENIDTPANREPYVNYCLIALNLIAFCWELALGANLPKAAETLGFTPARFLNCLQQAQIPQAVLPLVVSFFLHGNVLHLAPNILFLYIFGKEVEGNLGHGRFLSFYLAAGVGANLMYVVFSPFSNVPLIGASGAIAGVIAAYFSMAPRLRLTSVFIIVWVLLQFVYAIFAALVGMAGQAGIAWWAHVGGFLIGLILIRLIAPPWVKLIPLTANKKSPSKD